MNVLQILVSMEDVKMVLTSLFAIALQDMEAKDVTLTLMNVDQILANMEVFVLTC